MSTQLNVNGVSIRYSDHNAIENISFELQAGRIGCLLGPSGCGKTTMLRAIAGFTPVNKGSITLGDRLVADVVSRLHRIYRIPSHLRSNGDRALGGAGGDLLYRRHL